MLCFCFILFAMRSSEKNEEQKEKLSILFARVCQNLSFRFANCILFIALALNPLFAHAEEMCRIEIENCIVHERERGIGREREQNAESKHGLGLCMSVFGMK